MSQADKVTDKSEVDKEIDKLGKVSALTDRRYDLWKYCEERAEKTKERLWTTGTWLVTIIAAAITLPFTAQFIEVSDSEFALFVKYRIPTFFIGLFSTLLCVYSYFVIRSLNEHINRSWNRADYFVIGEFKDNSSTSAGQIILYFILSLLLLASIALIVLSVKPAI